MNVVNVCQVGYNDFCTSEGKLPSGMTGDDALAHVKHHTWLKDQEEKNLAKRKRVGKYTSSMEAHPPPLAEESKVVAPAPATLTSDDLQPPPPTIGLFGCSEFDTSAPMSITTPHPPPAGANAYPGFDSYDGGLYFLAWWITGVFPTLVSCSPPFMLSLNCVLRSTWHERTSCLCWLPKSTVIRHSATTCGIEGKAASKGEM